MSSRVSRPASTRPGPGNRRALLALCAGTNLAEAMTIYMTGPTQALALAPQAAAPPPFGVFEDLRWVAVYHNSWWSFLLEMVGVVAVRGVLTAGSVLVAWPKEIERPRPLAVFVRAVTATALAACLLAAPVSLLYGLALVPISWLFIAAVPAALAVAVIVHPAAVAPRWWATTVPLRSIAWIISTFCVISVSGILIDPSPSWVALPVALAAGVFEAWAWTAIVRALASRPAPTLLPVVPVSLALLVGGVIGGANAGFVAARSAEAGMPRSPLASSVGPTGAVRTVLVVSGYGSRWDGKPVHPIPGSFEEVQFSYRGLGAGGHPLPYGSSSTVQPIEQLVNLMRIEVDALVRRSGGPIDIVAESEGALVAKAYLELTLHPPVHMLVMASPLLYPGEVSYPPVGQNGWGVVTRDAMSEIGGAFQPIAPIDLSPQSPFLLSIDEAAPLLRPLLSCPVDGVSQFALLPLADAVASPPDTSLPFSSAVVSAFHGGLLSQAEGDDLVARVLRGGPRAVTTGWFWDAADHAISWSAAPWHVPDLDLGSAKSSDTIDNCSNLRSLFLRALPRAATT